MFSLIEFFNFLPRIWGQAAENLVLVAVPAFIFMGMMMERSGVAADLLYTVQVLLKRVPGALALARHHHGHDPCRDDRHHRRLGHDDDRAGAADHDAPGLQPRAGCGTIAASGTLGILIPPSIMLIIMADLMSVSVGNVYMAAWGPGLAPGRRSMSSSSSRSPPLKPSIAPPLPPELLNVPKGEMEPLVLQGVPAASIPDRADQRRDPVRLVNAERGRRGRRASARSCWRLFNGRLNY